MDVPVWIFARFREGTLEPYVHYVPLADDCSDLEAKMDYYTAHPEEAEVGWPYCHYAHILICIYPNTSIFNYTER